MISFPAVPGQAMIFLNRTCRRIAHSMIFLILLVWPLSVVGAENGDDRLDQSSEVTEGRLVTATVTDRVGNPIEGAIIERIEWKSESKAPLAWTNDKGEFRYPLQPKTGESDYVIIFKEGFALGALNLQALPARARLWPMRAIPFRVLDEQDDPVAGVTVAPQTISFVDEHLYSYLPPAIMKKVSVTTREDGWAILRCTRPEELVDVVVACSTRGSQTYCSNFANNRFTTLCLVKTIPGRLILREGDRPASGWRVIAESNDNHNRFDPNPVKTPITPTGIVVDGITDLEGFLDIPHALDGDEFYFMVIDSDGTYRGQKSATLTKAESECEITFEPAAKIAGRLFHIPVRDAQTDQPIAGMKITFYKNDAVGDRQVTESNENGDISVRLTPGVWTAHCTEAADGYCKTIVNDAQWTVTTKSESPLAPLSFYKGTPLHGSIVNVDLAIRRTRWLHVHWKLDEKSGRLSGLYRPDGTFTVLIPKNATAHTFEIVKPEGGSDELRIVKEEPLTLTSDLTIE